MTEAPRQRLPDRRRAGAFTYVLIAAAVWLGWEVVKVPIMVRTPPAIAVRFAPDSPEVLRRAAEAELAAEEWDDAAFLASQSLAAAPFNARALRVLGLATAGRGDLESADPLLTLAGNWSLRDDPAHAWLVAHRLRQGDYGSAFAHADTLARRRNDLHPVVFNLFTTAATGDTRALPPLVGLLAADPPWRASYIDELQRNEQGDALLLGLGMALQTTRRPLTDSELSRIYLEWASERRYAAMRALRVRLQRPAMSTAIQNGEFTQQLTEQLLPFGWSLGTDAGLIAEVVPDDLDPDNQALRVGYEGYRSPPAAQQTLSLGTGDHRFVVNHRTEVGDAGSMAWTLNCVEGGPPLLKMELGATSGSAQAWSQSTTQFRVPANCTAQRLILIPQSADRRTRAVLWFDKVSIAPVDLD